MKIESTEGKIEDLTKRHDQLLTELLEVQCSMGFNVLDPKYAVELRNDFKLVTDRLKYGFDHNKHMVLIGSEW